MRILLHLLTLIALLATPLAAPAAAMTRAPVAAECAEMAMGEDGSHEMPVGDHAAGEPCCIAVPPAIDPPATELATFAAAGHPTFIALAEPFRLGAGPHAEDPPPRIA